MFQQGIFLPEKMKNLLHNLGILFYTCNFSGSNFQQGIFNVCLAGHMQRSQKEKNNSKSLQINCSYPDGWSIHEEQSRHLTIIKTQQNKP